MTTAERFGAAATGRPATVSIAGVPWPMYKVVALLVGAIVCGVVALTTTAAGPAVLGGAGVATLLWLAGGVTRSPRR